MKLLTILTFIMLLSSCAVIYPPPLTQTAPPTKIFHKYHIKTTANQYSSFSVPNRRAEFEYETIEKDSIAQVLLMVATGYNEGTISEELVMVIGNEQEFILPIKKIVTREFVKTSSYSESTPVTSTNFVTTPASTEVVVQPDGKISNIHKPAVTESVTRTDYQNSNHNNSKSQLFNQGKFLLNKEHINAINAEGIKHFKLKLENADITITPSSYQIDKLKRFL